MKYYSELTRKFYENEKDCIEAEEKLRKDLEAVEEEQRKASEIRRQRAAEVEQVRDEFLAARKKYNDTLAKFCEDYGAYHCSIKNASPSSINDYFDSILNLF